MAHRDFEITQSFRVEAVPVAEPKAPESRESEEAAAQAKARKLGIPYINIRAHDLQPQTVKLISEAQARRYQAMVLEDRGDTFLVGFVDPWDLRAQDAIASTLKRGLDLAVITAEQLNDMIDRVYRKTEQIGQFAREVGADVEAQGIEFDLETLGGLEDAEAPIVKLLQTIFDDASRVNASDIHFEPQERCLTVRFRIDGILHVQVEADPRIASTLIVRLKLMAGLDIAERRLPQDGRLQVKSGDSRFDVRMSTMPTQFGESVVLRLLRQGSGRLQLSQIMTRRARLVF